MKKFKKLTMIILGSYLTLWFLWHSFHYYMVGKFFQDNILQTISIKHSIDEKVFISKLNYVSKRNSANSDTINKHYDIWLEKVKLRLSGYYFGIDKVKILDKKYKIVFRAKNKGLDYSIVFSSSSDVRNSLSSGIAYHIYNKTLSPFKFYFYKPDTTNTIIDSGYVQKME